MVSWRDIVFCAGLLAGCGAHKSHKHLISPEEQLSQVRQLYLDQIYNHVTIEGFILVDECDSLLFSSLAAIARGEEIQIDAAKDASGAWHRRPAMDCHLQLGGSSISRDMLVGLMAYMLYFSRLDLAEQLWEYGKKHSWTMGQETRPLDTRTILTPNLIGLLARIIHHMGGKDHNERFLPPIYSTAPGYVSHLTMLQMWMEARMSGSLGGLSIQQLDQIRTDSPRNPLAQAMYHKYVDGDQSLAKELLLSIWPQDRLPTSEDWCDPWRTQRADGDSGLEPCAAGIEHTGGDLLFVLRIMED